MKYPTARFLSALCLIVALPILSACGGGGGGGSAAPPSPPPAPPAPPPVVSAPTITRLEPPQGAVGESITITGTNFSATAASNTVTFAGASAAALVTEASTTQLKVTVPEGASSGPVRVAVAGSNTPAVSSTEFTVVPVEPPEPPPPPPPTITSLSSHEGGFDTVVTIIGTNFSDAGDNEVTFNGIPAKAVDTVSSTELKVTVPKDLDSTGDVLVTVAGTIAEAVEGVDTKFTYVPTVNVSTLAGNGNFGFVNAQGEQAEFSGPIGVAVTESGTVYVADSGNDVIRVIDSEGNVRALLGTAADFDDASGLALDEAGGKLYVASGAGNYVGVIDLNTCGANLNTCVVTDVAGQKGAADGYSGDGGPGSQAELSRPYGLTLNGDALYVAERKNHVIRRIALDDDFTVSTLAGDGVPGRDNGDATTGARFNEPAYIAVDSQGALLVTDIRNNSVRRIDEDGVVSTFAGRGPDTEDPGCTIANNPDAEVLKTPDCFLDGPSDEARFSWVEGIVVDDLGNVYVADSFNERIRRIAPDGMVTTLAGTGERTVNAASGVLDGSGDVATFDQPSGIAIDVDFDVSGRTTTLYVADWLNNRVRRVTIE